MLILDTDHFSELDRGSAAGQRLMTRLSNSTESIETTIVTVDEVLRGLLAQVGSARRNDRLVVAYARLQRAITDFSRSPILPLNDPAASVYARLKSQRLGIGSMDLRIASIVIANSATLLSRNLKDFERVPELKVEDWLS